MKKIIYFFFIITFVLFFRVTVTFASCTSFSDDFSESTLDTTKWNFVTDSGTSRIKNKGLEIVVPHSNTDKFSSVVLNQDISGDFSVKATFKSFSVSPTGTKTGFQTLQIFSADGNNFVDLYLLHGIKSIYVYNETNGIDSSSTGKVTNISGSEPIKVNIVRQGSTISAYYDVLDGKGFQLLKTYDNLFTSDVKVKLQSINTSPNYPETTANFDNFSLTCSDSATPTPTPTGGSAIPTITPGGPTATPIPTSGPTETPVPGCTCSSDSCTTQCVFRPLSSAAMKCSLSTSLFPTVPSTSDKNFWCQRSLRSRGDADGNGVINTTDYFYYVAAANGGKIPVTANPDFNGDGEVGLADRTLIVNTLASGISDIIPSPTTVPIETQSPTPTNAGVSPTLTPVPTTAAYTFTIQGVRVIMPGNHQGQEPYRSIPLVINPNGGTFSEEDPAVRARKAYSWSGLDSNTAYTVTVPRPPTPDANGVSDYTNVGYTACYNRTDCHENTPTPGWSFTVDPSKLNDNYNAAVYPTHYVDLWWHFSDPVPTTAAP